LKFLIDEIVVHDDRIEIRAKTANAVALMARAADLEADGVNHPEAFSQKGMNGSGCWTRTSDPAVNRRRRRSTK
jgi:hypothetical protein